MIQSGYGAFYCADNDYLYLLTNKGLDPNYKRKFVLTAQPESVKNLDENVSYLIPIGRGTLLNINPDLSYISGMQNKVFFSAFTRFFFFEQVPGFRLVFRSPSGTVKIFEYLGENAAKVEMNSGGNLLPFPTLELNEPGNASNSSSGPLFSNASEPPATQSNATQNATQNSGGNNSS